MIPPSSVPPRQPVMGPVAMAPVVGSGAAPRQPIPAAAPPSNGAAGLPGAVRPGAAPTVQAVPGASAGVNAGELGTPWQKQFPG